jgi:hypothetical protein
MRDTAVAVDDYGQPGVLLERFEPGPMVAPSHNALMAQAAFITEVAQDAKLARAARLQGVVHRARQQSHRRQLLERLPRSGGRPDPNQVAVRSLSGALDPPTRRAVAFDRAGYLAGLRAKSVRRRPAR